MNNDGFRVAAAMRWVATIAIAVGLIFTFIHGSDFTDRNLGLMVGMGMIIAGMMIFGFGTFVNLLHRETGRE